MEAELLIDMQQSVRRVTSWLSVYIAFTFRLVW
jgi:hypothetical protein